jgi:hypothetical protein
MKVFKLSLIGMIFLFLAGLIILEAQETTSTPEGNSEETEEDDIFSDDELFVPQEEIEDDNLADELNQEKITFSGELNFTLGYGLTRKFLTGEAPITDNLSSSAIDADFLLDIRFLEGIKAFGDLFVRYDGSEEISSLATLVGIKEVFLDTNIGLRVYFRLGKQVVKWGKGYLWNPTDYINLDRKNFLDLDVRRLHYLKQPLSLQAD